MITIRSTAGLSKPALIGLAAIITTQGRTYTFSSNGPVIDPTAPFGGGLFGAMSWPRSRFRLSSRVSLEQQMLLPHDGSGAALSWELRGEVIPVQLVVRPFFSGCGPRIYRDVGFRFESEENGGRLAWLSNVRGPKFIADSNGRYRDEPFRALESAREQDATAAENLIAPGSFEFQLSNHPSVLIFSTDSDVQPQRTRYVGAFLASLMPNGSSPNPAFVGREPACEPNQASPLPQQSQNRRRSSPRLPKADLKRFGPPP